MDQDLLEQDLQWQQDAQPHSSLQDQSNLSYPTAEEAEMHNQSHLHTDHIRESSQEALSLLPPLPKGSSELGLFIDSGDVAMGGLTKNNNSDIMLKRNFNSADQQGDKDLAHQLLQTPKGSCDKHEVHSVATRSAI